MKISTKNFRKISLFEELSLTIYSKTNWWCFDSQKKKKTLSSSPFNILFKKILFFEELALTI